MKVATYLNFPGNCEEAMSFYEKHLGAKVLVKSRFSDERFGQFRDKFGINWMVIHEKPMRAPR